MCRDSCARPRYAFLVFVPRQLAFLVYRCASAISTSARDVAPFGRRVFLFEVSSFSDFTEEITPLPLRYFLGLLSSPRENSPPGPLLPSNEGGGLCRPKKESRTLVVPRPANAKRSEDPFGQLTYFFFGSKLHTLTLRDRAHCTVCTYSYELCNSSGRSCHVATMRTHTGGRRPSCCYEGW